VDVGVQRREVTGGHVAPDLLDRASTRDDGADSVLVQDEILDQLGAVAAGRIARQRLRTLGATRIPRGPRPETRENPAGLTARQAEVLGLLAAGATNADIADQLVLSVRTVDHHVAAILQKLGAPSRRDAARIAMEQGLVPLS
jgi:DNA-binding NarL/FixJ family response regulator